jgi:hypothetical protein
MTTENLQANNRVRSGEPESCRSYETTLKAGREAPDRRAPIRTMPRRSVVKNLARQGTAPAIEAIT